MNYRPIAIMGVLLVTPPVTAQEPPAAPAAPTVSSLITEFNDASTAWRKAWRAARKAGKRGPAIPRPNAAQYGDRMLAAVKATEAPDDALKGLTWIIQRNRYGAQRATAIRMVGERFTSHPSMGSVATSLQRDMTTAGVQLLRTLLAESPHAEVKGKTCFSLAKALRGQAKSRTFLASSSKARQYLASYRRMYGDAEVDTWMTRDAAAYEREAEQLLERVAREFSGLKHYRGTLGKAAANELFEIRNLAIGKVAPEIAGADAAGNAFTLSDFRGKIVVIDFWGDW